MTDLMNQSINDEAVYRTAPATPGLLNITFHLVLGLRKCSNFHKLFNKVSGSFPSPWIITSSHYVELGTPRTMGLLWRLSCNCEYSSTWNTN